MPFCRLFDIFLLRCVACALYSKRELTGKEKAYVQNRKRNLKRAKSPFSYIIYFHIDFLSKVIILSRKTYNILRQYSDDVKTKRGIV